MHDQSVQFSFIRESRLIYSEMESFLSSMINIASFHKLSTIFLTFSVSLNSYSQIKSPGVVYIFHELMPLAR